MEDIKKQICELALQLDAIAIEEQDDLIEGVAYIHSAFAHTILKAYNECEYRNALLIRAG